MERRPLLRCWWGCRPVRPLRRTVSSLTEQAAELPCDPAARSSAHTQTVAQQDTHALSPQQPGQGSSPNAHDRRVHEEDVAHVRSGRLLRHGEERNHAFVAAWMQAESLVLSEARKTARRHARPRLCGIQSATSVNVSMHQKRHGGTPRADRRLPEGKAFRGGAGQGWADLSRCKRRGERRGPTAQHREPRATSCDKP